MVPSDPPQEKEGINLQGNPEPYTLAETPTIVAALTIQSLMYKHLKMTIS
jgi:hypothetical protein